MSSDFYQITVGEQGERLEALGRAALQAWGYPSDSDMQLLKYRENAVFRVAHNGEVSVLRVHRAGYHSDAALASELEWISALHCAQLRTPRLLPTPDGRPFVHASAAGVPEARQVDHWAWITGKPMGTIESGLDDTADVTGLFTQLGRLMAISHDRAADFQPSPGFVRHAWNLAGLLGEQPVWGRFWELASLDAAQRQRMIAVRERARPVLEEYGTAPDRYGLIHADFVPENLLVNDSGVTVIDFDDAGFGWHLFDMATCLFFHLGQEYYADAYQAFCAGYQQCRQLPERMESLLPLFFLLRGTTYLGWIHTRPEVAMDSELAPLLIALVDEMAKEFLDES